MVREFFLLHELTDNVLNAKNLGRKVGQNLLEQAGSLFTKKNEYFNN